MRKDPNDAVLRLMAGETSAAEVAAEHGVTVSELESWRRLWLAGARAAVGARQRRWIALKVAGAAIAVAALTLWGRVAMAGNCASTLPAPLVTFCASQPAYAGDVNNNFQGVIDMVGTKVGPLASPDVTVAGSLNVSGNAMVSGNATVSGTLNLGGYVKSCASAPCYCNATNEVPVNWGATCSGSGVAFYSANLVTDPQQHRGFDAKCTTFNFMATPEALQMSITCMRLTSS